MATGGRIPLESLDTSYESEPRASDHGTAAPLVEIIAADDSLLDEFASESGDSGPEPVGETLVSDEPALFASETAADLVRSHTDEPDQHQRPSPLRKFVAAAATLAVGIGLHALLPDSAPPPAPSPSAPRASNPAPVPTGKIADPAASPAALAPTVQEQSPPTPAPLVVDKVPPRVAVTAAATPQPQTTEPIEEDEGESAPLVVSSPIDTAATAAVAPAPVPNDEAIADVRRETEIRSVLDAYRDSYERLDAVSAARLWPGVDTAALSKAFSTLSMQEVEFDSCNLGVTDQVATANCNGSLRYIRKVGSSALQSRALAWTFELERSAGRWLITRVTAR